MTTTPLTRCTHEVLPLTAPIAVRCEDCGRLMPYVPEPFGEPIVLTENGAYAKSEYERQFPLTTRLAHRPMTRDAINAWARRTLALVPNMTDAETERATYLRDRGYTPSQTAATILAAR